MSSIDTPPPDGTAELAMGTQGQRVETDCWATDDPNLVVTRDNNADIDEWFITHKPTGTYIPVHPTMYRSVRHAQSTANALAARADWAPERSSSAMRDAIHAESMPPAIFARHCYAHHRQSCTQCANDIKRQVQAFDPTTATAIVTEIQESSLEHPDTQEVVDGHLVELTCGHGPNWVQADSADTSGEPPFAPNDGFPCLECGTGLTRVEISLAAFATV